MEKMFETKFDNWNVVPLQWYQQSNNQLLCDQLIYDQLTNDQQFFDQSNFANWYLSPNM
jgi:hypothetical protein